MDRCPHCDFALDGEPHDGRPSSCPSCGGAIPPEPSEEREPSSEAAPAESRPSVSGPSADEELPLLERAGRYTIQARLGIGGFGTVYRGFDEELHRDVAIKVPHSHRTKSEEDIESYLAEARALACLDHPGIVPVYDVGRMEDGRCYLVSKFIEGSNLAEEMRQRKLDHRGAAELVASVAEALHHANQRGLVHRDVKPANILLDSSGQAYVADFGLALRDEDVRENQGVVGTPQYMSPEQASGEAHRVDARSDVYSLGVVLYELLTGRTPFRANDVQGLIRKITTGEPRPPRQIDDTIPKPLDRICLKAISRRVRDRYSTAIDFADDLRVWLAPARSAGTSAIATQAANPTPATSSPSPTPMPFVSSSPGGTRVTASSAQEMLSSIPSVRRLPDASVSDLTRVQVVPRGLRSFGLEDASFFLELLPGPRDREGLPDSVRFWKKHIEDTDPEATFSVGLIYGPSGCGKSSLVKAGILPRLASHVTPYYLEATPQGTERRILTGLRRLFPEMPQDLELPESLLELRKGNGLPRGEKLVLVIDQFEQWLHMHGAQAETELVRALRQCDPSRVQSIIMARDDFWMSVSRFMRELEVWLVEGENSAAVDLFSLRHARKVLAGFGRSLGCLPERDEELSDDQKGFLRRAVEELAEDRKVISVRLALFSDMLKNRAWSTKTLKEVGGAEGIGTRFFEETFSSSTAPPEHRLHQQAARRVLRALIYLSGEAADIKGGVRTRAELLEASGYQNRPEAFDHLLRILDGELRILTPTDPQGAQPDPESQEDEINREPCYQLTHDYLVKPLRSWLTKKQRETVRGRAELRLSDRSTLWNTKPQKSYLPAFWEWANVVLCTRRRDWTRPQKRMLRSAKRYHLARLGLLVLGVLVIGLGAREIHGRFQAAKLHEQVLYVEPREMPDIVRALEPFRRWVNPLLSESIATAEEDSREKLNASLALLPADPAPLDYLQKRAFELEGDHFTVVRNALRPHREKLSDRLWTILVDERAEEKRRLRAGALLAHFEGEDIQRSRPETRSRWKDVAPYLTERLLALSEDDTARFDNLVKGLQPAGRVLLDEIRKAYRDLDRSDSERSVARNLAAEYSERDIEVIADIVVNAGVTARFEENLMTLEANPAPAIDFLKRALTREFDQEVRPEWKDPPPSATWTEVDPATREKIEASLGMLQQRFAFCQTMPIAEALGVVESLRPSGYRPTRFRPYRSGQSLRAAVLWTRDDLEWRLEVGLETDEVTEKGRVWSLDGYFPCDLAAYVEESEMRHVLLGSRSPDVEQVELSVAIPEDGMWAEWTRLQPKPHAPITWHVVRLPNGELRYSSIWIEGKSVPERNMIWIRAVPQAFLDKQEFPISEVSIVATPSSREVAAATLAYAESMIEKDPKDKSALYSRGAALYQLGRYEEAIEALTSGREQFPEESEFLQARMQAYVRLGKVPEARSDYQAFAALHTDELGRVYLRSILSAAEGRADSGAAALEEMVDQHADDPSYLFLLGQAYVVTSTVIESQDPQKAAQFRDRALELAESALDKKRTYQSALSHPAWDPVRAHPRYLKWTQELRLDRRFVSINSSRPGFEAKPLLGIEVEQHLERARSLEAEGYRPVSLSVTSIQEGTAVEAASAWQRPVRGERAREAFAKGKARAAALLARLGEADVLWPMLKHGAEPDERSFLIHLFASMGVEPEILVERLGKEDDVSVRRAILQALGEYDGNQVAEGERLSFGGKVLELFRSDPDPGIHASAGWLLERWGQSKQLRAARERIRSTDASPSSDGAREWRVDGEGHTLVQVQGELEAELGSPGSEYGRGYHEQRHTRRIPRDFDIAAHLVTVEQFQRFLDAKPGLLGKLEMPKDADPRRPITGISWLDAQRYCQWLNEKEGFELPARFRLASHELQSTAQFPAGYLSLPLYRLPTEWEWEHACRAGAVTAYAFGDSPSLLENYDWLQESFDEDEKPRPMPVGLLKPNDLGLFDMHGNVHELCQNRYEERFFDLDQKVHEDSDKGRGWSISPYTTVSARGGRFDDPATHARSALRGARRANYRGEGLGFRVARTIPRFAIVPENQLARGSAEFFIAGPSGSFAVGAVSEGVEVVPGEGRIPAKITVRARDGGARAFSFEATHSASGTTRSARGTLVQGPDWNVRHYNWDHSEQEPQRDGDWRRIVAVPPSATLSAPEIRYDWGNDSPAKNVQKDHFASVAETTWEVPAGRYEIRTFADNGVRVTIDGELVLRRWESTGESTGSSTLEAGKHAIRIEHYDLGGTASLIFEVWPLP